jgi:hypothetical protein
MSFVSFAQIRKAARLVAERSPHVGVVTARADELAASYRAPDVPTSSVPAGVRREDALEFLVTRAALRFGSGYEPRLRLPAGVTIGELVDRSLTAHFEREGPIPVAQMLQATTADMTALFASGGPTEPPQAELADLQARALRDLGRFLLERFEGSCAALVESAQGSASKLCETLSTIPYFHDVQRYSGIDVPFFHRAQMLARDVAAAADGDGLGRFEDIDALVVSSDAEAALALRTEGVLVFDDALSGRIENGELVPAHGEREVEIRAATVHAVERMVATLRAGGTRAVAADVDAWLRPRARAARAAGRLPHRTRSVFY